MQKAEKDAPVMENVNYIPNISGKKDFIPSVDNNYIPWGHYNTIKELIVSQKFCPVWVTGLAGNGKTQMVEQACAELQRSFVRVNFTIETDENDLLGGFRLRNGETIFEEGPVITAMRTGSILLLDEVDVGHTNKVMCLQSILEGKAAHIKCKNEYVYPAPGFQIFATSNTKGRGSEDGKFAGTNMINEAMRDRFAGMLEQDYPDKETEMRIIQNYFIDFMWSSKGIAEDDIPSDDARAASQFLATLIDWAFQIRETFRAGAYDEVVTTRTLVNIIKLYAILGNKKQAIEMACERYPTQAKIDFMDIYQKLDITELQDGEPAEKEPDNVTESGDKIWNKP